MEKLNITTITIHKIIVSMMFGFIGFIVNFYPVDFVFYGSHEMSLLFGLLFPILITLSWGWKYGLLSALCGGCQTMWLVGFSQNGYGALVYVPIFTIWVVWTGWFSRSIFNIYIGEILFRIFNIIILYTIFRWLFVFNIPTDNLRIPLPEVHLMVLKDLVNGFLIIFVAQTVLYLKTVRIFFGLPKLEEGELRAYCIRIIYIVLCSMLILGFIADKYIICMFCPEFQDIARIFCLLLLLFGGVMCLSLVARILIGGKNDESDIINKLIHRSEEKFRSLVENSIDCVWTLNTRLKFTYLSPSVERMMGFKPEQCVGTKLRSHFRKKEFLKVGVLAVKSLKNYKTFDYVTFETKMINSKNEEVDLEISGRALLNCHGKLIGLQGIAKDITERKQSEEKLTEVEQIHSEMINLSWGLRESNKKLEAMTLQLKNVNKELEAFAYSASHDLRAPLRNIDGFSQILLEDYSDILDKQGRHYLQRVRAGTQNMGQLIDDILSLSRSGRHTMDKKTINMGSIVREVYDSFENELKDRKVDLVVHECPPAIADSHLVKIVLTNLLSNALKFTRIRKNAKIETGSMTEDGNTVFFIKDNGIGFDMQYADKLFSTFQRLHSAEEYEGSGIGLAIVQRIIHRHGGSIWAESEVDIGTTFYFTLMEKR